MNIKKNDIVNIDISAISSDGNGIGKIDGFAIFVPMTDIGDNVDVHIIKVTKNYAVGKIKNLNVLSQNRCNDDCTSYSRCGGCCFRHISYEKELEYKREYVTSNMKRIGKLDIKVTPVVPCDFPERYRNKAVYPVQKKDSKIQIGFFSKHSHRIIECTDCMLQPEIFSDIISALKDFLQKNDYSIYDEVSDSGVLKHIFLRKGAVSDEVMVCFIINADTLPLQNDIVTLLTEKFPSIKSISVNINKTFGNAILSDKNRTIYGESTITDTLCDIKLDISPLSFYQINHNTAEKIYKKAAEIAELKPNDVLLDLYCGTGSIGLSMADRVKTLVGVEIIPQAVENAAKNAKANGIENARFICADAKAAVKQLHSEEISPTVVVLDPPRKGCDREVIETVVSMTPERIVMISCDSATLARDLAVFKELGYIADTVIPYDMFPRTNHVECVVRLRKADTNQF